MKHTSKFNFKRGYQHWGIKAKYIVLVEAIVAISLFISYIIFIQDKIMYTETIIKNSLKDSAVSVVNNGIVQESLKEQQINPELQEYATYLTSEMGNVDLIVIADMNGKKYVHPDESQIGQIFEGEDKQDVLEYGESYFSVKEGSMGKTLRYFCPIMSDGEQVGFVMVGKYTDVIGKLYEEIRIKYVLLLAVFLIISFFATSAISDYFKSIMLNMEPEEIAALYLQQDTILNNVQDGVILVDSKSAIQEISKRAREILENHLPEELLQKVSVYLFDREIVRLQEIVVGGKRVIVSIIPLMKKGQYYGAVITLMDWDEVNQVAKEMTGIEQKNKNLRATIHEFKNNLHIILGLLQLKEYQEAQSYILQIQNMQLSREEKILTIDDSHVRAMLMSKASIAKERQVKLELKEGSCLMSSHGYVNENDLTTIVGNLIENAIEACNMSKLPERKVIVSFMETKEYIDIEVSDNGVSIDQAIVDTIFQMGVSTKGEDRGTGLYLVKRKADIYHGLVQMEEVNGVKTFKVRLIKGEIYE